MNRRASSVESAGRRKALLRIVLLLAQLAEPQSKSHPNVGSLSHANHWNVDNEYHMDDYMYHSAFDGDELSCPSGFSGVMAAIVIAELGASTTTPRQSQNTSFTRPAVKKAHRSESQNGGTHEYKFDADSDSGTGVERSSR
jgi:hypothetical protein